MIRTNFLNRSLPISESDEFLSATFLGADKLNGVPVWMRQFPITLGGIIGPMGANIKEVAAGTFMSRAAADFGGGTQTSNMFVPGGTPVGCLAFSQERAKSDINRESPGSYAESEACTLFIWGPVQFANFASSAALTMASVPQVKTTKGTTADDGVPLGGLAFGKTSGATTGVYVTLKATILQLPGKGNANTLTLFLGVGLGLTLTSEDLPAVQRADTPVIKGKTESLKAGDKLLLSAGKEAAVFYTLDGTTPTANSIHADGGRIQLDTKGTVSLKAIAIESNKAVSEVLSTTFKVE